MAEDRAVVLSRLARGMAARRDAPLAERLAAVCAEILEVGGAALTIGFDEQSRLTVVAVDEASARLAQLQDGHRRGPRPRRLP